MCGITGYYGNKNMGKYLYNSLKRLDYRGYDSAGIATLNNGKINIKKDTGEVEQINQKHNLEKTDGKIGVGHTRWSTHGSTTKQNAHPHLSCDERFAIAHNGIIENWKDLKSQLNGHRYTSETDSEVIAHYIEEKSKEMSVEEAVKKFFKEAKGSLAVVLLDSKEEKMYAFKRGSPLALGIGNDETFLGSDLYAFSTETDKAIFFEDDEYGIIDQTGYVIKNINGEEVEKEPENFDWDQEEAGKEGYEHYMRKEIGEIPQAVERLENSLNSAQEKQVDRFVELIKNHEKILFTASGTSYHASLMGVYFLNKADIEAQTLIASEFKNYERVDEDTLVIAISQSGETKDVLDAMEYSRKEGADIASIINVPYSSVERESDVSLRIMAGQEVCVAATKTFINQIYTLLKIANKLGYQNHLEEIPKRIEKVIEKNEPKIKQLAKELKNKNDIYIIGRGDTYPIAREIALKLKEIPYIHAEGMMGGELKHGTLALIEEDVPVISLIPEKNSEIISNVKEIEARNAKSIKISPWTGPFKFPNSNSKFPFYTIIIGFLLSYWIANEKNLPIDRPRNLSKSITVS
ncbi:hypothetical protein AKJ52_00845 [candidate division MSBL1 archaeon SCGC-AAA382C18]|uniref:Glutamine--fructose-6-phosphate aminotransferase [isomerizing] n=1 Tax=candidate division MSBL1 archaeon SCGC-AAA382C18 TaxID=1698281 RepID=A0A133VL13_9EURY|nr:hypothetical protein AKJ52_00845 [candidate division MSBL1 archaeon SCGC-AAA382C18]